MHTGQQQTETAYEKSTRADLPAAPITAATNNGLTSLSGTTTLAGQPTISELLVTSNPTDAVVEVSGAVAGKTPLTVRLNPVGFGFNLQVMKEGYKTWFVQSVSSPGRQVFNAELQIESTPVPELKGSPYRELFNPE